MSLIRYRTLKYPPSWRSNTELADFDFFADKIVLALERQINWFLSSPMMLKSAPNRKTCKQLQVLVRRCKTFEASEQPITIWSFNKRDLLWWVIGTPVFDSDFALVRCLLCKTDYAPSQCRQDKWSIGEGLAAEGGKRLLCPRDHLLFTRTEWNS